MNTRKYTTNSMFPEFDRFFIGMDSLVDKMNVPQASAKYPPYNIIKTSDNSYLVELAVAGFSEADIDITVKEGILTVKGEASEAERNFLHKGIAARSFVRTFTLADTVEVHGATLENGMLCIELENILPESKLEKKIGITSYRTANPQLLNEKTGSL